MKTRKVYSTYKELLRPDNLCFELLLLLNKYKVYIFKIFKDKENFQDIENFQHMEGLFLNHVEIPVENQDMENFQDIENFKDLEAQHHN